jgi:hypothetical protein
VLTLSTGKTAFLACTGNGVVEIEPVSACRRQNFSKYRDFARVTSTKRFSLVSIPLKASTGLLQEVDNTTNDKVAHCSGRAELGQTHDNNQIKNQNMVNTYTMTVYW